MQGAGLCLGALCVLAWAATPAQGLAAPQSFRIGYRADQEGRAPLAVTFLSEAPKGYRVRWDFGDGQRGEGREAEHTYYRPGSYTFRVELLDAQGRVAGQTSQALTVKSAGPERAALTLLPYPGGVRLSAEGSVVYAPLRARYWVGDREVKGGVALPLGTGAHPLAVRVDGTAGPLNKGITLKMAPVSGSAPLEAEVLRLTNQARAQGWNCATKRWDGRRLGSLKRDALLDRAATAQSVGMALHGYFDHVSGLDGSTPAQRIAASGYRASSSAENIAAGYPSAQQVVSAWLRSPGHCANIMGDFRNIGVSFVRRPGTVSEFYWTQAFGTPWGS